MPTVWFSLKKSLHCKPDPKEVHDPKSKKHLATILTRKPGRSGCSRSIANLKDVIHGGNVRHSEKPVTCSPRSIGSSEFVNPIAHEVIFSDSKCELKISGFNGGVTGGSGAGGGGGDGFSFVGTLLPGTPGPGGPLTMHNFKNQQTCSRKIGIPQKPKACLETEFNGSSAAADEAAVTCHKCGKQFGKWENLEAHHLSKHAADGNELLRFYGTTIACSLGINGESSLCVSDKCCVCRIIRHGFSTKRELKGGIGVFTTSTSARAFESIEVYDDGPDTRKALMVCRVIAGRVHRPLENIQEITGQTGFDSLAGKIGLHSNIEDLYLLSPKALLPCFVVICKL
ncbi:hypothetical protein L1987_02388 [Smallanthus sonchifolius]|uniref:Uncharacterized protein n=1 Tax=Smallanthus sonchifolius TaxID=185202 RepID=A0ACB9K7U2_9ASTR|nr:hypothetical protein L1987_02388 [Smallanthus sonchifolius]